jgi:hypothetical protein
MVTTKPALQAVSNGPMLHRTKHHGFQDFAARTDRYHYKRYLRTHDIREDEGVLIPEKHSDRHLTSRVVLHPDALPYFFFLSGHPLRLLHYIIFFEMNPKNGEFKRHGLMEMRYADHCSRFDQQPSKETIKKAFAELVQQNTILSVSRGTYRVNPMISGGTSEEARRSLINEYCQALIMKGKDGTKDLYPMYHK